MGLLFVLATDKIRERYRTQKKHSYLGKFIIPILRAAVIINHAYTFTSYCVRPLWHDQNNSALARDSSLTTCRIPEQPPVKGRC